MAQLSVVVAVLACFVAAGDSTAGCIAVIRHRDPHSAQCRDTRAGGGSAEGPAGIGSRGPPLEVIVHTPDMAIVTGGDPVVGLGLWESAIGTYFLEAVMVLGGLWLYLRATAGTSRLARFGMVSFVGFMLLFNVFNLFQPAPDADASVSTLAIPAVAGYLAFAGVALWLDRARKPLLTRDEVFNARVEVGPAIVS